MLEKKELVELAKLKSLKPWQQEKHYLQAVMLEILSDYPIVFKGGTYLWFYHGLPRFSEDLDFTATQELTKNLPETVSKSLELFGIENKNKTITNNNTTLSFRISTKGPLNTSQIDECRVYVEISKRENILEKTIPIKLDFPEYNLPTKRITGMKLTELSAEKIRAIITRNKARDAYDLNYLIEKKKIPFKKTLANQKLEYYNKKFTKKEFLEKVKSKQEYYKKELKNLVFEELPNYKKIVKNLKNWIE
ncbi:MAG: nucleotidyl transferase AbiEii/AbiGii toxin family protein [archaeon]